MKHDALQCGFCTPGMVMACKALLDKNKSPSLVQIKKGLSGNICRCGTYNNIFAAVQTAAKNARLTERTSHAKDQDQGRLPRRPGRHQGDRGHHPRRRAARPGASTPSSSTSAPPSSASTASSRSPAAPSTPTTSTPRGCCGARCCTRPGARPPSSRWTSRRAKAMPGRARRPRVQGRGPAAAVPRGRDPGDRRRQRGAWPRTPSAR